MLIKTLNSSIETQNVPIETLNSLIETQKVPKKTVKKIMVALQTKRLTSKSAGNQPLASLRRRTVPLDI